MKNYGLVQLLFHSLEEQKVAYGSLGYFKIRTKQYKTGKYNLIFMHNQKYCNIHSAGIRR